MTNELMVRTNAQHLEEEKPAAWSRDEKELAILGCLLYDDKCDINLLTEDDFTGKNRQIFKAIRYLKLQKADVNPDDVVKLGEEMGVIVAREDYQLISMMNVLGDQPEFFRKYISDIRNGGGPNQANQDQTLARGVNIYNIGPEGGIPLGQEIPASPRDTCVTPSVTDRDSLSDRIEEWIARTTGWFTYSQLDSEIGVRTTAEKANRRKILERLTDKGIVERHSEKEGIYRHVKTSLERLDLRNINHKSLDVRLPFGIENYVRIYPGNVIVVAGAPNAGKTAFMLNVIKLNLERYGDRIRYFCSEMGAEELRSRLDMFPMSDDDLERFEVVARTSDFADVIAPDWVNLIDYLEISTDLWLISDHLTAIHNKLRNGIAIVAIQKKRGISLGRGAEFGLEKPRLYITMDSNVLRIEKAKTWKDKKVNPNGMVAKFKLVNGCEFIESQPLTGEAADQQPPPQTVVFGQDGQVVG